jgi:hypothetical protein
MALSNPKRAVASAALFGYNTVTTNHDIAEACNHDPIRLKNCANQNRRYAGTDKAAKVRKTNLERNHDGAAGRYSSLHARGDGTCLHCTP